jgi:hypothetical protein
VAFNLQVLPGTRVETKRDHLRVNHSGYAGPGLEPIAQPLIETRIDALGKLSDQD